MEALLANIDWYEIWLATLDTFLMLGGSLLFTVLLGLPLGVLLFLTGPRQLFEQKADLLGANLLRVSMRGRLRRGSRNQRGSSAFLACLHAMLRRWPYRKSDRCRRKL